MDSNAVMALMAKLELLYGEAEDAFLAFQNPGLPVSPRDLSFNLPESESDLTPQEALNASADFARLVNLIPAYSSIWSSDGRMLWDEYKTVLNQALVASQSLTEPQMAELQEAQKVVDSKKLDTYRRYEKAYLDALEQYNARKLSAENSTDPKIKQDWQVEEPTYKAKVNRAYSDWVAKGYKAEVDEAFADIDRLTGRNPQLAWATWKQDFQDTIPATDLNGQEFYETSFWPSKFFKPDAQGQWTTLELDASEIAALSLKASGSTRQRFSRSSSAVDETQALDLDISHLSVELTRVEIMRPWFNPSVFRSRFWKWPHEREPLSDGQEPPQGSLPGYAISIIFARNLEIKLKPNSESNKRIVKQLQAAKPIYIGPLRLKQVNSSIDPTLVSTLKSAHLAPISLKEFEPVMVRRGVVPNLTARVQPISRTPEAALRSDWIGSISRIPIIDPEVYAKIRTIQTEEKIIFDTFPDGTPTTPDRFLTGDEFLAKGIRLAGSPESTYCAEATATAIRRAGTYGGITFPFLTTASPGQINRCNTIPIAIAFTRPVRQVTLTFAGASVTYTMKAYDSEGKLLGTIQKDAVFREGTSEITFSSATPNISRITFGHQTAMTAIKEIHYKPSPKEVEEEQKTEGLQLIAFLCQKLPKFPNPDPTLNYS